jgi:uncharacterized protein YcfL
MKQIIFILILGLTSLILVGCASSQPHCDAYENKAA